jgi:hypothetical protein
MDHAEIVRKLSAYLDGAVTPREKALIEKHMETCAECRTALGELERTVARLRDLEDVEPPPWLTQRVMARVREEAAQEKGWFRRLFVPFRWKLPLEAFALVFLTVTSYLVYQELSPELKMKDAPSMAAPESPSPAPAPAAEPEKPVTERSLPTQKEAPGAVGGARDRAAGNHEPAATLGAESGKKRETRAPEPMQPAPAPVPQTGTPHKGAPASSPMEERAPVSREERSQPPGFSADDYGRSEKKMKRQALKKDLEGSGYAPAPEYSARGNESPAPSFQAKSVAPAGAEQLRLVIKVADRSAGIREVERLAELSRARLVRKGSHGGTGIVLVRLDRKDLQEFFDRLDWIGEVHGKGAASPLGEGVVELVIEVTAKP